MFRIYKPFILNLQSMHTFLGLNSIEHNKSYYCESV